MDTALLDFAGNDLENLQLTDDGKVRLPDGREYALKTLAELYGPATGTTSIDTENEAHLQLMMAIEATILEHDHHGPGLSDGAVLLALEQLATSPEGAARGDALVAAIQRALRLRLSVANHDRHEVRLVFRRLVRSVQGHTKRGGRRSYLDFIHAHVPHKH